MSDAASPDAGGFKVDLDRIQAAVAEILVAIGEDLTRDGLQETPARVARMYAEVCSGIHEDPAAHLIRTFDVDHDEMVMVRDIPSTPSASTTCCRSSESPTWPTSPGGAG